MTVMVPNMRVPQQTWSWRSRKRASGILRVLGCDGLISQLLPYNRIWWRASRARTTWARVSLHVVPCSQTGNWAPKSLIPALYPYVKTHLQYVSVKSPISLQMVSSTVYGPFPKAKPVPLYLLLLVINTFRININLSWLSWEPNGKMTDLSALQMWTFYQEGTPLCGSKLAVLKGGCKANQTLPVLLREGLSLSFCLFFGFSLAPVLLNSYFPHNQADIIGVCLETDALSSSQCQNYNSLLFLMEKRCKISRRPQFTWCLIC